MIKKEWYWMLNLPINKDFEDQDHLEDGIDDFTPIQRINPITMMTTIINPL